MYSLEQASKASKQIRCIRYLPYLDPRRLPSQGRQISRLIVDCDSGFFDVDVDVVSRARFQRTKSTRLLTVRMRQ